MAINIGSGIGSQLLVAQETIGGTGTYGTAPTLSSTNARMYEFKSESLALSKTTVQGQGLHGGGLYDRQRRRVLTTYSAGGNVAMDLPTRNLGILLKAMLGADGQPGVIGSGTTASPLPTQMGTTGVYRSIYQGPAGSQTVGGLKGTSLTLQKGLPPVDGTSAPLPFTYVGAKIADWTLTVGTGALAELTLTFDAMAEMAGTVGGPSIVPGQNVPALYTGWSPNYNQVNTNLFHFREATLFVNTTTATLVTTSADATIAAVTNYVTLSTGSATQSNVKQIQIQHQAQMDTGRYFLGSNGFKAEPIENNFRSLKGSFDVEWLTAEAMYAAFSADATIALKLSLVGNIIGSSGSNTELLEITIPSIKLDGVSPQANGPAVVQQNVTFTALDDETTVPIQIAYQSLDSVY